MMKHEQVEEWKRMKKKENKKVTDGDVWVVWVFSKKKKKKRREEKYEYKYKPKGGK